MTLAVAEALNPNKRNQTSGRSDRNGHWVGAGLVRWAPENKVGIPKLNREDGNSE